MNEVQKVERLRALDACRKLRLSIDDAVTMLNAIEGARTQMASTSDELRGQTTIIKERVNWLIRELDTLEASYRNAATKPGDAR